MKFAIKTVTIAAALSIAAGVAIGGSHGASGPHAYAIKARQAVMTLYEFNIAQLGAMAKGDIEYNADAAKAAASNLAAASMLDQSAMWPQGSDAGAHDGTRAKAEIWSNYPDVAANGKALVEAAAAMVDAAGTDLDALRAAMGPLGQACNTCHKSFRVEQ